MSDHLLAPQPVGIPVPRSSGLARPYWDGLREGELRFQRCSSCGNAVFNPAVVCARCLGRELVWVASSGRGTLYSWTVVWRPQTPAFQVPYAPAIVALEEGWWLVSAVVGCRPDDLRADMPLAVEFHPAGEDVVLPYFAPT